MRRGEVWTISGGGAYADKPRPAVIIQDDRFDATDSITVCLFTTVLREAPLFRLAVEPSELNGLRRPSRLMVDKISTVPRTKIGSRLGRLAAGDVLRLNKALICFLGLGPSPRAAARTDET